MLHHPDRPVNQSYGGKGSRNSTTSSLRLLSNNQQQSNMKGNKDGNFNFLSSQDDELLLLSSTTGGDENRNQMRPRGHGPSGREPSSYSSSSSSLSSPSFHYGAGPLSPLSRLPCWSPLEPLPEIESGDDGYGRVPPDGAEEGKMEEEETGRMMSVNEKETLQGGKEGVELGEGDEEEEEEEEEVEGEDGDEWGDSDSEFEFSYRSGGSLSSLNMESGGEGALMGMWDRIGVGEPKPDHQGGDTEETALCAMDTDPTRSWDSKELPGMKRSRKTLERSGTGNRLLDEDEDGGGSSDTEDACGEIPELMDAVWTLRDRERFKAQEMEKHQVQLTMYRRLALIRWVRTLQGRVSEQQNRLQSSFDVILTHRKELLRMGAVATTTASQS